MKTHSWKVSYYAGNISPQITKQQINLYEEKIKNNRKMINTTQEEWKNRILCQNQRRMLKTEEGRKKKLKEMKERAEMHSIKIQNTKEEFEKV
jgi:hypothetical protein